MDSKKTKHTNDRVRGLPSLFLGAYTPLTAVPTDLLNAADYPVDGLSFVSVRCDTQVIRRDSPPRASESH